LRGDEKMLTEELAAEAVRPAPAQVDGAVAEQDHAGAATSGRGHCVVCGLVLPVAALETCLTCVHPRDQQGGACAICEERAPTGEALAKHFERCFESYCPTTSEATSTVVPRAFRWSGLGTLRLPGVAIESLLLEFLPPSMLCVFEQTPKAGQQLIDSANPWPQLVERLLQGLWAYAPRGMPDGSCGCSFPNPASTSISAKRQCFALWNVHTATQATLELKTLTLKPEFFHLPRDRATIGSPVLLQTSVRDLKAMYKATGATVQLLIDSHAKQLLHDDAPLAAHLWISFALSRKPRLIFNEILTMSNGHGDRAGRFHFSCSAS